MGTDMPSRVMTRKVTKINESPYLGGILIARAKCSITPKKQDRANNRRVSTLDFNGDSELTSGLKMSANNKMLKTYEIRNCH